MRIRQSGAMAWAVMAALGAASFGQGVDATSASAEGYRQVGNREEWKGVDAEGNLTGAATYQVRPGPKGWWNHGLRVEHDGTINGRAWAGLVMEIEKSDAAEVAVEVKVRTPRRPDRQDYVAESKAVVRVAGSGAKRLWVPWSAFDFKRGQSAFLKFIERVEIGVEGGRVKLVRVGLARGEAVALGAEVRSKIVEGPGAVSYPVTIYNCTGEVQAVTLSLGRRGWEAMAGRVTPEALTLPPGGKAEVRVEVEVPGRVPPGGTEKQVLRAMANGRELAALELITGRDVARPYLLHTEGRWREVREKVRKQDWAKRRQEEYVARARQWEVPEVARLARPPGDGMGRYLFATNNESALIACGIAWQLTREKAFAEKVATFLRRLSNPENGYPTTLRGCNQALVQEGHFFKHINQAYDMILDAGVLTVADKEQIGRTLRLYMETIDFETDTGNVSNWTLSEQSGALFSALNVGDVERAWRFYEGDNGVLDQLGHGIMDDGWWYECSISYNGWMAQLGTELGLAVEPWGKNLLHGKIPNGYSANYSVVPWAMTAGHLGMSFDKFGPVKRNHVKLTDLWDGFLPFVDYRGIMFGANDSDEKQTGGGLYELAYHVNRDPKYAAMIKYANGRDLLWGVPELPEKTPELFRTSAAADNAGVVVLRSQTAGREPSEQIQAVLKYGTHGGYHGHFDRASLLSVMRHGRSFYNPEITWFGYASYLYKFYAQTSLMHNMVVVDRKMQEPVDSRRLLFHAGEAMQVAAMETRARWSYPPYGGMVYSDQPGVNGFAEKSYLEGRSFPMTGEGVEAPAYGAVTGFTEPVLQRRLMVVTDDYLVVADYLKGEREHDFDLLHLVKGFRGIEGAGGQPRHTATWDKDPLNGAMLTTDCRWYDVKGTAVMRGEMVFGREGPADGSGTNRNVPGVLKMDYHSVWPPARQVMVGNAPENVPGVAKRATYAVRAGGKVLAQGKVGAWVIGTGEIDVAVNGLEEVELTAGLEGASGRVRPTLFWGNPRVVTAEGKEVAVTADRARLENVIAAPAEGKDYQGGALTMAGVPLGNALPAEPADAGRPGTVRVNLRGLGAVRLRGTFGADAFPGAGADRLMTTSVHTRGTEARFLTVIEPHDERPGVVKRVTAESAGRVRVELADGRVQEITIDGLESVAGETRVTLTETKEGATRRVESTHPAAVNGGTP